MKIRVGCVSGNMYLFLLILKIRIFKVRAVGDDEQEGPECILFRANTDVVK